MKNIGEILKEARERRGFSRDVLADLISVSKETIARWERGKRSPDARALKKLQRLSVFQSSSRSEERRVGKECRSRWSPYH